MRVIRHSGKIPPFRKKRERMGHPAGKTIGNWGEYPPFRKRRERMGHPALNRTLLVRGLTSHIAASRRLFFVMWNCTYWQHLLNVEKGRWREWPNPRLRTISKIAISSPST